MLVIIPARGGSKGVYRKNIRMLGGKPLIQWTIESALKAKSIDKIIISTDDDEIADVCRSIGIEILFMRPKALAQDDSLAIDNYLYTMGRMINEFGYARDEFVVLLPTVPFRTSADIDGAVEVFYKNNADSVISCNQLSHPLDWIFSIDQHGIIERKNNKATDKLMNRQDSEPVYIPNGGVYIFKYTLLKENYNYYSDKSFAYVMPEERSIDIDTEIDFGFAEFLVSRG
jgi:CMP-N,N'-diacetyllegionaminic acid synthase